MSVLWQVTFVAASTMGCAGKINNIVLEPGDSAFLHQPRLPSAVVVVEMVSIASASGHGDHHLPMDDELEKQSRGSCNAVAAQRDDDVLGNAQIWPAAQDGFRDALAVSSRSARSALYKGCAAVRTMTPHVLAKWRGLRTQYAHAPLMH
mgnify:CR=1 FL=1